jgi:hypothetical protein
MGSAPKCTLPHSGDVCVLVASTDPARFTTPTGARGAISIDTWTTSREALQTRQPCKRRIAAVQKKDQVKILARCLVSLALVTTGALHAPPAMAAAVDVISGSSLEFNSQTGPPNTVSLIADFLGFYPNLIGPGGHLTGVQFDGNSMEVAASSSSLFNTSWWDLWNIGKTQTATNTFYWATVLQLTDTSGPADLYLNWTYFNSRLNAVFEGNTRSWSHVAFNTFAPGYFGPYYSQNAADAVYRFVYDADRPGSVGVAPYRDQYTQLNYVLDYSHYFDFAALSSADESISGTLPLGQLNPNDYLWIVGELSAGTEVQAYYYSTEIATIVTLLNTSLEAVPVTSAVPEPESVVSVALGLVVLVASRRRSQLCRSRAGRAA